MPRRTLLASLLFAAACSAAYADQPVAGPALSSSQIALSVAPARIRAPYDVQILRGDGEALPTYAQRDRFYVLGAVDDRYVIRITNPTARRIEAVVSVDGLDVIDGENGDLRKRGYVVPAYGETRIEGFRTSQADVATFRFSSVGGSYAGQKGKARNVGVIAVAISPPPRHHRPYDYRDDLDGRAGRGSDAADEARRPATTAKYDASGDRHGFDRSAPRKAKRAAEAEAPASRPAPRPSPTPAPGPAGGGYAPPSDDYAEDRIAPEPMPQRQPRERAGLGTEFGEQRYSAASYTRFVRGHGRPIAIAELRYNDAAGLMALGIPVQPLPDHGEVMLRETADPFPGDRFARPVR
ncbi:MAG: hypothetical protein E6J91_31215 [Deltaproteobacteria bacterium]|nr:MAG: hypothetical protein E6J91_31215 [Deltaproteobacteria bacterium]